MSRVTKIALLAFAILSMTACTSRQLYNVVQMNRIQRCDHLIGQQRQDCRARYEMSYDEYERERKKLLKAEPKPALDDKQPSPTR